MIANALMMKTVMGGQCSTRATIAIGTNIRSA
jgi:hypothetical protein